MREMNAPVFDTQIPAESSAPEPAGNAKRLVRLVVSQILRRQLRIGFKAEGRPEQHDPHSTPDRALPARNPCPSRHYAPSCPCPRQRKPRHQTIRGDGRSPLPAEPATLSPPVLRCPARQLRHRSTAAFSFNTASASARLARSSGTRRMGGGSIRSSFDPLSVMFPKVAATE